MNNSELHTQIVARLTHSVSKVESDGECTKITFSDSLFTDIYGCPVIIAVVTVHHSSKSFSTEIPNESKRTSANREKLCKQQRLIGDVLDFMTRLNSIGYSEYGIMVSDEGAL